MWQTCSDCGVVVVVMVVVVIVVVVVAVAIAVAVGVVVVVLNVKRYSSIVHYLRATWHHLPYGITVLPATRHK